MLLLCLLLVALVVLAGLALRNRLHAPRRCDTVTEVSDQPTPPAPSSTPKPCLKKSTARTVG